LDNSGNGIANVVADLAIEQARLGHTVSVASSGGSYVELLTAHGVQHHEIEFRVRRPRAILRAYLNLARAVRETDAELLHSHTLTPTVLGRLILRRPRPRLVATVHNEYQHGVGLMLLADLIVGVSEAVSAAMKSRGARASRVRTIRNGVLGTTRRQPPSASETPKLPASSIVTVGAVSRRKGADVLVAAFRLLADRFRDTHLYFVGNVDWMDPVDACRGETWGSRVHFVGFDPQPQRYLSEATVFVLPSREDPFPLALLEALGAGVPCIGSDVDGIPEALAFGDAGLLVRVEDPSDLAEKLAVLLGDPERRAALGDAARRRAAGFTVVDMARHYLDAYSSMATV
jgi:glycosyltransferase involved in cell wall biosynthesis